MKHIHTRKIQYQCRMEDVVWFVVYYLHGTRHNTNGPAFIEYREDGSPYSMSYYHQDKWHRTNGPAHSKYHPDGTLARASYYLHGVSQPQGKA